MGKISKKLNISQEYNESVEEISETLKSKGFECYLIGGSVRDLLLGNSVEDFDFATNAHPSEVVKLFRRVIPTGIKHGTVTVLLKDKSFEITTYRADGKYKDGRRPETVSFSDTLEEDVLRRDFTINGLAYDVEKGEIIDYVKGIEDLDKKIIRTIGNAIDRLSEDGLRSYRACRFAAKLNFEIEQETFSAIGQTLHITELVSAERVKDELMKLMTADKPSVGIEYMRKSGLLKLFLPELDACYGIGQNRFHVHDIYYHSLYSCDGADKYRPDIRLTALLHDIGKLPTKNPGSDGDYTFYNHEVVGARLVRKILKRLKFSNDHVSQMNNLVINHMFHYTDDWTDGAVRRFMRKVGVENLEDLFLVRMADRVGNGSRYGLPEPINILKKRIKKAQDDENAITVKDLSIDGNRIMELFTIKPGPVIGKILNELLERILDDPELNEEEKLIEMAKDIFDSLNE